MLIVFQVFESVHRLLVMEQHCVQVFERKILVADKRAQHLFNAKRELLCHALERYYWNVRVLDVGPNQILPV